MVAAADEKEECLDGNRAAEEEGAVGGCGEGGEVRGSGAEAAGSGLEGGWDDTGAGDRSGRGGCQEAGLEVGAAAGLIRLIPAVEPDGANTSVDSLEGEQVRGAGMQRSSPSPGGAGMARTTPIRLLPAGDDVIGSGVSAAARAAAAAAAAMSAGQYLGAAAGSMLQVCGSFGWLLSIVTLPHIV